MNVEQMETALKRYGFDSTDPLLVWLNAAMHDIENDMDWPWLESSGPETVNTVAGKLNLTLPFNTLKVLTLRDATNKVKLEYYDYHKFVREVEDPTQTGFPEIYTRSGLQLYVTLYPIPSAVFAMELTVQFETLDMTGPASEPQTGVTVWPVESHFLIVQRAAALALMAENEEERAKTAQEQYEKGLDKLRRKFVRRNLDENKTVEDVMEYGNAGALGRIW